MLTTERRQTILTLAWPIIGAMLSQNIVNLVDTAMVGNLPNPNPALAATGMGGFLSFMSSAFITGLAAGVQAMSARRLGEGRGGGDGVAAEWGVGVGGGAGDAVGGGALLVCAVGVWKFMQDDPEVLAQGVPYYRMRLLGMVVFGCNFAFRGYWNGTNYSKFYMRTLFIMHGCNVFEFGC